MRLIVKLRARRSFDYEDEEANYKTLGRLWRALRDTPYGAEHDRDRSAPFCFALPDYQPGGYDEGDVAHLAVSARDEDLLACLSGDFRRDPELNMGPMCWDIIEGWGKNDDHVSVGESGSLGTTTGTLVTVHPRTEGYWSDDYHESLFRARLRDITSHKAADYDLGDERIPLFEEIDHIKTFGCRKQLDTSFTGTLVLSKWRFEYEVRDAQHRDYLNLLLDTGLGEKTTYGFGFLDHREGS